MHVVLGVAAGIAAYKACSLLRLFKEAGHDVTVVPTDAALNFVGSATWAALSGRPVATNVFDAVHEVPHVRIGQQADLVVVAPATADLLARTAYGRADDLLASVLLTATCPVIFAPAMHTEMWLHAATQANVATLRQRGIVILEPAVGRLTGKDSGPGRMPEPAEIFDLANSILADPTIADKGRDLSGRTVVVSAGGTQEQLDPVRFIGNRSSGKMGIALAEAALLRGAEVHLIAANLSIATPSGAVRHDVESTADLAHTMQQLAPESDIVIMAAAPADFTASMVSSKKIKKSHAEPLTLTLVQTIDVLASVCKHKTQQQVFVGFAAETATDQAELIKLGQEKRQRKGCDIIVCNDVSAGAVFGSTQTEVVIVDASGSQQASGSKALVAHRILDAVKHHLPSA